MIIAGLLFSMIQTNVLAAPCDKGAEKKLAKEVSKVVSRMPASKKDESSDEKILKITFKDRAKCLGAIGLSVGRLVGATAIASGATVADAIEGGAHAALTTVAGIFVDEENNVFLKVKPAYFTRNFSKKVSNAIATDLANFCIFTEDYALSPDKSH